MIAKSFSVSGPLRDVFRVEFNKKRWTSLYVSLSAEEHVPFQYAFREGGRAGENTVPDRFQLFWFHGQAWKVLRWQNLHC